MMKVLEAAINKYLSLDPELPARLDRFEGKIVCVDIIGLNTQLYLLPEGRRISVRRNVDTEPDATLRGTPVALFKMGLMRNVAPMLLQGEVEIIGDMRLGRAFKSMLAEMQIDWEEQLSAFTGDIAAHEIVKTATRLGEWGKQTGESVLMDTGEYLQEESRDVVTGAELEQFYQDVDSLRMETERLEARINRLLQDKAC